MAHEQYSSGKTTPVMEQYQAIKAKHPDTILFFHIGDFYETFGSDAELVAKELEIVLTSRSKDRSGARIPLAGVPYHAAEGYINRLIGKGYRVAVCDQVEDARQAKGIVRREVVRVITPGTVIDSGLLPSAGASYLMACVPDGNAIGLAFLDVSTGDFFASVCPGQEPLDEFSTVLAQYRPAECVVPERLPEAVRELLRDRSIVVTPFRDDVFGLAVAERCLLEQFHVPTLEGYGLRDQPLAVRAAGAALAYARETQKSPLAHIGGIGLRPPAGAMVLDAITLRNLEIFENIRGGGTDATLLATLDRTGTPMGGRLLRAWLTRPLLDPVGIAARLDAVEYLVRNPRVRGDLRSLLRACSDTERIAGRIAYGNATPRDLVTLRQSLEAVPGLRRILDAVHAGGEPAVIAKALQDCEPLPETASLIARAIADDPPPSVRNGGVIRAGYDQQLDGLRQLATSGRDWIAAFQAEERQKTGIRSLKVGYTSVFGYYIEVTKPNIGAVPPHYERKQTTSTGERYTTPELREKEAQIATADERLLALEGDLFATLLANLASQVPALQQVSRGMGVLDVVASLAEAAQRNGYSRPTVDASSQLLIREGRHPVVEQRMAGRFVANDTMLDAGGDQILVITGANMAGKSTYMRAVGLTAIMAQIGSFVPAGHARIGLIDRIFTRVGAFDDLASGQSTFMVEMLELAQILNAATDRSLVILDEIGRGTSTLDGYAIARSVLEHLHGKGSNGPRTLFATHFHELIALETDLRRVKNYHFAVRDTGAEVIFLRKLIPGATDRSYGVHVARLAGVPRRVTDRANAILAGAMQAQGEGGGKVRAYTQMLLIDAPPSRGDELLREIRALELDAMTPIEALSALYDLQKRAKGEK